MGDGYWDLIERRDAARQRAHDLYFEHEDAELEERRLGAELSRRFPMHGPLAEDEQSHAELMADMGRMLTAAYQPSILALLAERDWSHLEGNTITIKKYKDFSEATT